MPDLFIAGEWRSAQGGREREIRCPADGTHVATVDEAGPEDTVAAIEAARESFDSGVWSQTSVHDRSALLHKVADLLVANKAEVARAESLDTGKRLVESEYDVDDIVGVFRYYANTAAEDAGRVVDTGQAGVRSRIVHEPVGVCALITPWNYPLLQTSWKVAPCLAAGNSFVLKPSELTPSTAILLMHYLTEAGLPPGVGNLVLGAGPDAGAPLSTHPDVDLVSFTGGLQTGRILMANAAATVKKVALELGGKNPNIVFADADREVALDMALTAVFLHSGQVCSAGARLVVQDSIKAEFIDELVARAKQIRLGGPFDDKAETGALISAGHREKVEAYVDRAREQGATVRCGGARPDDPSLADGLLLPADDPRRLHARHGRGAGRVLRPGADGRVLQRRGRRGGDRQRQHLRPGRRGLDRERRQGRAGRVPAPDGHGLDQRLPPVRPAGRVGRLQAVRLRPRARWHRDRGVPRDQAHLAQRQPRGAALVR